MTSTSVSHLKSSLSKYLRIIRNGEEVIITNRGKPVAKIVPIDREKWNIPSHLSALESRGAVRLGTGKIPEGFWNIPRLQDKKNKALSALLNDRAESR